VTIAMGVLVPDDTKPQVSWVLSLIEVRVEEAYIRPSSSWNRTNAKAGNGSSGINWRPGLKSKIGVKERRCCLGLWLILLCREMDSILSKHCWMRGLDGNWVIKMA
jgi:hypothetical protein